MQVAQHVHALKIPFQLKAGPGVIIDRSVYAYIIYGKRIYLIDSGVSTSVDTIFNDINESGRSPEEISMVILTHSHPDHIGGAAAVQRSTGCSIAAHAAEIPWIEDVDRQFKERPVPGFHSIVGGPVNVDRILKDGEVVELEEGLHLKVFHTPGHSAGSISLLLMEDNALFTGDAIPLTTDAPIYDDAPASVSSIKRLKNVRGVDTLLSAWDDPKKGDNVYESMDEGLRYLQRVHQAVIKLSGTTRDPMALCKKVLPEIGLPENIVNPLAARSIAANLKVLDRKDLLE